MNELSRRATTLKNNTDYEHHILNWETSALSQFKYCELNNLNYKRFITLRSKLKISRGETADTTKKQKFIPVLNENEKCIPEKNNHSSTITIRLAKGSVIELPINLEKNQLNVIFSVLAGVL